MSSSSSAGMLFDTSNVWVCAERVSEFEFDVWMLWAGV